MLKLNILSWQFEIQGFKTARIGHVEGLEMIGHTAFLGYSYNYELSHISAIIRNPRI